VPPVEILKGYRPTTAQRRIHESRARFKVLSGGIRSGKTLSGAADFVLQILRDLDQGRGHPLYSDGPWRKRMRPLLLYWVIAPTHALLKESITYITDAFPPNMRECWLENEGALWLRTPRGFICIEFKSAEEPERLVSRAVNGVFIDEAARCPAATWPILRGRMTDFEAFAVAASSPVGGRGNWLYRDLIARADEDAQIECHPLRTIDNPIISLDEVRRAKEQMPERFFRRDYLADWSSWGSAAYPEFDPVVHRVSERRLMMELGYGSAKLADIKGTFRDVIVAVDFGYTAPACMLAIVQLANGDYVVAEELYESGLVVSDPDPNRRTLVQEAWKLVRRWSMGTGPVQFICDTEDAQARAQFTSSGLSTQPARKDITHGARKLSTLLHVNATTKRPRLRVLDGCKQTCDTLPRISWALDKNGDPVEGTFGGGVPLHAADALRYGAAWLTRHDDDGIEKVPAVYTHQLLGSAVGFKRV
jgi:hypothetical protein